MIAERLQGDGRAQTILILFVLCIFYNRFVEIAPNPTILIKRIIRWAGLSRDFASILVVSHYLPLLLLRYCPQSKILNSEKLRALAVFQITLWNSSLRVRWRSCLRSLVPFSIRIMFLSFENKTRSYSHLKARENPAIPSELSSDQSSLFTLKGRKAVILSRLREEMLQFHSHPYEKIYFHASLLTDFQLFHVTEAMREACERRKTTSAVFLDTEKAFDSVWHDGILFKMIKIGIGQGISREPLFRGSNGSVISSGAWQAIFPNIRLTVFADDTVLYSSILIRCMQAAVKPVVDWGAHQYRWYGRRQVHQKKKKNCPELWNHHWRQNCRLVQSS